jgi:hypothetical protein
MSGGRHGAAFDVVVALGSLGAVPERGVGLRSGRARRDPERTPAGRVRRAPGAQARRRARADPGFVGLPVFLQATLMSAHRAIVQIAGDGLVVRAADFLEVAHSDGPFQAVGKRFGLTQEFLGLMLGAGRQAVNEAAQALQDREVIAYTRGQIAVLDRAGLEAASCERSGVIRDEFDRLLPAAP